MALSLLDGSNTNIDVQFGIGVANALVSFKCFSSMVSVRTHRDFTERTTFCSGGARSRTPGMKQIFIHLEGFGSEGSAGSDPSALFANTTGVPFVVTADTGATWTGNCHAADDISTIQAAANHNRGIDLESTGTWVVVWPVS